MSEPIKIPRATLSPNVDDRLVEMKEKAEILRFGAHTRWVTSQSYFTPSYVDFARSWFAFRNPLIYDWSLFNERDPYDRLYLSIVIERLRNQNPFDLPNLRDSDVSKKLNAFLAQLEIIWNYCYVEYA